MRILLAVPFYVLAPCVSRFGGPPSFRAATHPVGRRTKQTRKSQPITNAAHKNVVLSLVQRGGKVRGWASKVAEIAPKLRCSKCNSREVNV